MKKVVYLITIITILFVVKTSGQTNQILIDASLNVDTHELQIQQKIVFHNNSEYSLDTIYFHNWMNSYRDNETPLSKRLIEDFDKSLYFSKERHRGHTSINNISIDYSPINWEEVKYSSDIIAVPLKEKLKPKEVREIQLTYSVKIPLDKFTGYGRDKETYYNLRYWYIVPAMFDQKWQLMSNLNMDDLLMDVADYTIDISIPKNYNLSSNLLEESTRNETTNTYHLIGKKRVDIELNISKLDEFRSYNTKNVAFQSNLNSKKLDLNVKTDILNRELSFIEEHLGIYPHDKIFVNSTSYNKNPVYGFNQLPSFLQPFSDVFEWDIKMFKALTKVYLEHTLLINKREDTWLVDGIQNFLMMNYVSTYYPEIKAIGGISKIWGIRTFHISKLDFNDKYPFVYQFATRKNVDQSLITRSDSLSNFNRKIVNKYKAGLGIRYLDEYLENSIVSNNIKDYYANNLMKLSHSNQFKHLIINETDKDVSWFFGDYVKSKKKIDYTIKKVKRDKDSITITIKNKRNITAPVTLYGLSNDEIIFKNWVTQIDSTTTFKIPNIDIDRLSLNYEFLYPELNLRDNWKSIKKRLLNKPIKFKFLKDVENPYYNEIYYTPSVRFNYYDGLQFGMRFTNKAFLNKPFTYKITPFYGFKSKDLVGSFSALYEYTIEETAIDKLQFGMAGSYFHYDENLSYQSFSPYAVLNFKRKNLRDAGGKAIIASLTAIDKDFDPNDPTPNLEENKYNVFNISYVYSKPEIIQDLRYATNLEFESKFTKLSLDLRYRRLTDNNRQFDFRFFFGAFLKNETESDFFSYGLSKQSDYLFRLNYFGRSEESGFFSQQYITNEGGFKTHLEQNYANQWMTSFNTSIGLWRWIEIYNDIGFLKNKNETPFFAYESGIRLNFVHEILEVYFPLYSNNGWDVSLPNYSSKIRFVLTINPKKIIGFARRGFF